MGTTEPLVEAKMVSRAQKGSKELLSLLGPLGIFAAEKAIYYIELSKALGSKEFNEVQRGSL